MKHPPYLTAPLVRNAIQTALAEDLDELGDVTTFALVDPNAVAEGCVLTREPCVAAGAEIGRAVLLAVDPSLACDILATDGATLAPNDPLLRVRGKAASILTAERTLLNFIQRLCGIATLTRQFVDAVAGTKAMVLDTRKTTPNFRAFEKYAVRCGGGENHRFGLFDRVLMKDNHRRLWREGDASRLDLAIAAARKKYPGLMVEIEVETLEELHSALAGKPEWIMLDNMSIAMMRECVAVTAGRAKLEASGGITLERAREVAETGVDAISLGCLTHSAKAVDLTLEWDVA
jgi:nicotinate-nucleotide pyrophosphorylase (carboxylating)